MVSLRPVDEEALEAFTRADLAAFGESSLNRQRFALDWTHIELDRTMAAFSGSDIVATGRCYTLELTLPGDTIVPTAAVSWIAVLPTHRRQGLLTAVMARLLDQAEERGEALAVLLASEGVIYRRFGFGVATSSMSARLDRRHAGFLLPTTGAPRVRLIDEAAARTVLPPVFDRARRTEPGAVERVEAWWPGELFFPDPNEEGNKFFAVHDPEGDGEPDGYVVYRVISAWADGVHKGRLVVDDLVSTTDAAREALWRYVCGVDLVETIEIASSPVDDPLRWMLAESRRLQPARVSDGLWVRILDTAQALEARRYAVADRLVVDVVDPNGRRGAAGRFAVEGGPDGAHATRTTAEPDLVLDVADLGAALLGGVTFSTLARARLVEERSPGALARADVLFRCEPLPYTSTWF